MKEIIKNILRRIILFILGVLNENKDKMQFLGGGGANLDLISKIDVIQNNINNFLLHEIDCVKQDNFYYFVYKNDYVNYRMFSEDNKNQRISTASLRIKKYDIFDSAVFIKNFDKEQKNWLSILKFLFAHCHTNAIYPDFVDVGANIGTISVNIADLIRRSMLPGRIFSFEPGQCSNLISYTLSINGFGDISTFEKIAVSDINSYTVMKNFSGLTVSNGITSAQFNNQHPASYDIVKVCRLDKYFSNHNSPLICKIDTEGNDASVIQGMTGILEKSILGIVFEYTIQSMEDIGVNYIMPLKILAENDYLLFNLSPSLVEINSGKTLSFFEIDTDEEELNKFCINVKNTFQFTQTDILALSPNFPYRDSVVDTIKKWNSN
jgi:FkbM family methyltransferase